MMVGLRAETGLWQPLADWLRHQGRAGPQAEEDAGKPAPRRSRQKRRPVIKTQA
jgi:hypothetical protein